MDDPTYAERNDIITVDDEDLGPVRMQAVVPKLRNHAGRVWRVGAPLGADNELVYKEFLGMSDAAYADLEPRASSERGSTSAAASGTNCGSVTPSWTTSKVTVRGMPIRRSSGGQPGTLVTNLIESSVTSSGVARATCRHLRTPGSCCVSMMKL